MNWVDLGIILVLVIAAISGARAGLVQGVVLLFALITGAVFARLYDQALGTLLIGQSAHAHWLGFGIIMSIAALTGWMLGNFVRGLAHALWLGWADGLGGVVMGLAAGILVLSLLLRGLDTPRRSPDWAADAIKASELGHPVEETGALLYDKLARSFET